MYLYQISFIITIHLVRNGSALRNICFTDDFSVAGKHIATRRQLHVEERAAGFSVNWLIVIEKKKITIPDWLIVIEKKKDNDSGLVNCY